MSYTPKNTKKVQIKKIGTGDIGYNKDVVATFTETCSLSMGEFMTANPLFINDDFFVCSCDAGLPSGELRCYRLNIGFIDSFTLIDTIIYTDKSPFNITYANGRIFLVAYRDFGGVACILYDIEIDPTTGLFGSVIESSLSISYAREVSAHPTKIGYVGCNCIVGGSDGISFFQDGAQVDRTLMPNGFFSFRFFPRPSAGIQLYVIAGNPGIGDEIYIYNDSHDLLIQEPDHAVNYARDIVVGAPGGGVEYKRYMAQFHTSSTDPCIIIHQYNANTITFPRYNKQVLAINGTSYFPSTGIWSSNHRELFFISDKILSKWSLDLTDLSLSLNSIPIYYPEEGHFMEQYGKIDINFDIQRLLIIENFITSSSYLYGSRLRCYKIY